MVPRRLRQPRTVKRDRGFSAEFEIFFVVFQIPWMSAIDANPSRNRIQNGSKSPYIPAGLSDGARTGVGGNARHPARLFS